MARHLKSIVKNRLKGIISYNAPHSEISASHARGVCYFVPVECYNAYWGAMNTVNESRRYKKHIIVRRVPRSGVLQLYTYHFPKNWSPACVANRELIKEAQRRAHALEKDFGPVGLEWRVRFFKHYFRVFRCGEKPEPGMKRYSRFYQYVYVAIYRELKERMKELTNEGMKELRNEGMKEVEIEEISVEPIEIRPRIRSFSSPMRRAYNSFMNRDLQQPDIQEVMFYRKIPHTTEEFAHVG